MKYVFIINPHSGNNEHNQLKDKITKHFKGKKIIIEKTTAPKQATIIAKSYASNTTELIHMFACGGDGTIHEIVNGIAGCNHIILSIVPIGTGNDFIKSLDNYSKSDFLDLSKYDRPILMPCDLMLVNNEYAINTISLGFDVHVAKHVNTFRKKINIGGIIPYYLGMLASLIKPLNEKLNISMDPVDFPSLKGVVGDDLIVTDGTTLLGADDKAGIVEIMDLAEKIMKDSSISMVISN